MKEKRYVFLVMKKECLQDFPNYLDYVFIEYVYKLEKDELILLDDTNTNVKVNYYFERNKFRNLLEELKKYVCL